MSPVIKTFVQIDSMTPEMGINLNVYYIDKANVENAPQEWHKHKARF